MTSDPRRRWPRISLALLGVCLALAPVAFGMFSKAPRGAAMLASFRPFMTVPRLAGFQTDMADIGGSVSAGQRAIGDLSARAGSAATAATLRRGFDPFVGEWPRVDSDMGGMLTQIQHDRPDYQAMAAMPSFRLFPFFFLIPGLLIALLALIGIRVPRLWMRTRWGIAVLGVALVCAPFAFGLFSAGPKGASMMSTFKTIETRPHLRRLQGYFTDIVVAQGEVQLQIVPALQHAGLSEAQINARYRGLGRLDSHWIHVLNDMTPMLAAMSNNITNYAALLTLPSFRFFPWFFLLPGLIVLGLALLGWSAPTPPRQRSNMRTRRRTKLALGALGGTIVLSLATSSAWASVQLRGVFHVQGNSWIRMQLPTGGYFSNPYSASANKTYTPISSGPGAGLRTGVAQGLPSPAWDSHGDSLAKSIVNPTNFTDVFFGVITTRPPSFELSHGEITGNDYYLVAEWNNQSFRQGSSHVTGTYDSATRHFVLDWHTTVHGGAFDGYTGWWQLSGTFIPYS